MVSAPTTKAEILMDGESPDEDWGPGKWELHEAVGQGKWFMSGRKLGIPMRPLPFEALVTRMVFNDAGQVQAIASLSEDRFIERRLHHQPLR